VVDAERDPRPVIHLDTSFLIMALVPGSPEDARVRGWLGAGTPIGISAVSWAEFLCGPVESADIDLASRVLPDPVSFVAADSDLAARLFVRGGRRRGALADCMIAATAIRLDAELATVNPGDFRRFLAAGLKLVAEPDRRPRRPVG
jgi:predicted nucleic acid-binding protein